MVRLTLLHTNDLHGRVEQLLRIATLVREIRVQIEARGGYCFFLDAGDSEDTALLESSLTKGSAMEAILAGAGCEFAALGNAIPLRYGPEAVANLAAHFGKPLLCGNMYTKQGNLIKGLLPYTIQTIGPVKAGLIGLTDPIDVYSVVFNLDARGPAEVLPGLISEVRSRGATTVILLSHLSSPKDRRLAEEVPGIDVIIGGHDHKQLDPPLVINGTIIAQAGEFGQFVGRLELEINQETGKVTNHRGELIAVDETIPIDPHTRKTVAREQKRVREIMSSKVGILEKAVALSAEKECAAGNLLADALLERMQGAQFAMVLASHWTTGLDSGELTQGALFAANRSTANPARLELSGEQILQFMREALKPENAARKLYALRGGAVGMPHVAGMRVRYNVEDIENLAIEISGKPLRAKEKYEVASTDWEFSEMVNYLVIPDEQIDYEIPTIMPEVLDDYIRGHSPLKVPGTKRFTARSTG